MNIIPLNTSSSVGSSSTSVGYYYANMQHQESTGVGGGSSTSGSKVSRNLNTIITNENNIIVSLSNNQFILLAGSYEIVGNFNFVQSGDIQMYLHNTTSDTTLISGTATYIGTANSSTTGNPQLSGKFIVTSNQILEIQYRCNISISGDGQGNPANFGTTEIYANVVLKKVS